VPDEEAFLMDTAAAARIVVGARGSRGCAHDDIHDVIVREVERSRADVIAVILRAVAGPTPANVAASPAPAI
jgi:hypothetical protein